MSRQTLAEVSDGPAIAPSGEAFSLRAKLVQPSQNGPLVAQPLRGPAHPVNLPTMPLDEYRAAKAAASSGGGPELRARPAAHCKGVLTLSFTGAVEGESTDSLYPPDVDAAVGRSQILQPTNSNIDVWSKRGAHLYSIDDNSFLGNSRDTFGDGRAVFDSTYNRWVVLLSDFSTLTGTGQPLYYLAVSQTSDATGAYFIFSDNLGKLPPNEFIDFTQLGLDQNALLITANMFRCTTSSCADFFLVGPIVFAVPKARVYNGLSYSVPIFSVSLSNCPLCTLAPPFVEDNNGRDFFMAAPIDSGVTAVKKFTMAQSGQSNVTFAGPVNIPVAPYSVPPPNANQTCTGSNPELQIETLDGRFENRSYQYGALLWQTHPTSQAGRSVPIFYEFNTTTNQVVQQGKFSLSNTSFDFNPHIASNASGSAVVTWTATDPANGKNALVLFGARTSATAPGTMPVGPIIAGSTTCLIDNFDSGFDSQRWGDYSAANLDPALPGTFWVTNEKIAGGATPTDHWSTEFGEIKP
ncbi:MAG: hypothetical protein JO189_10670 [Deltaproteobacteria bacterium]|nr:hypothetical protein [Deltaproteobacteria bacterium]